MPQSEFWPFGRNKAPDVGFNRETSFMQKQLGDMEGQVKEIQMELAAIKRDRMDLLAQNQNQISLKESEGANDTSVAVGNCVKPHGSFDKYTELSKLREELLKANSTAEEERMTREKYEKMLKDLEFKLHNICSSGAVPETKDPRKCAEEELSVLKKQMRDIKEELEETKLTVTERTDQLQEYRVKYLQAQQEVEELKRQLDIVEIDNKQVSDQLQVEIQRMKMQFQEKLQELAPLPDLLKGAQIQLEEARQFQKLAEDTSQQLSDELNHVKEELSMVVNKLNGETHDKSKVLEDNKNYKTLLEQKQKEIVEQYQKIDEYKCQILRLDEKLSIEATRYNEKTSQCMQLVIDIEDVREENKRAFNRAKERAESMRNYLHKQVSELERQLIQCRAKCKAVCKERDEIRRHIQMQINNLQENFELVEIRLHALHTQVTSLMNASLLVHSTNEDNELN